MSFFDSLNTSASGLTAQRLRLDVISENLANANTTRTKDGTPYKRKTVLFQERENATPFEQVFSNVFNRGADGKGVRVSGIVKDESSGAFVYDPEHPDANEEGYVEQSNVNVVQEMVNMISASRSYEANITSMNVSKTIMGKTLEMGAK